MHVFKAFHTPSKEGAKVVVFDMSFERCSEFDADFAQAMRETKNTGTSVIVGVRKFDGRKSVLVEELRSAASGWGVLDIGQRGMPD